MPYLVSVEQYEGPLDLLVQLVERNQLEITGISAAMVTEQFLAHIEQLEQDDPTELSDFLQLASRLVYIKSLALLSGSQDGEDLAELRQLDRELAEYRRYQLGVRRLHDLDNNGQRSWSRSATKPPQTFRPPQIDQAQLATIFQTALNNTPKLPISHRLDAEVTLEEMQERIRRQVQISPVPLANLVSSCRDRGEIIVLFLALLELIRQAEMGAVQEAAFGPMVVSYV